LRRLLDRHLFPVLNAMVVFYLLDQVRRVAVALPIAARFLFLAEMAGGVAFAAWLFGSRRLRALREQNARLAKGMRAGAQIALAVFAVALAANAIGCVDLGNLLGNAALQSACLAVVLYAATRVANGLIAGGLSAQPLGGLRMVRHHRTLLWQRTHRLFDVAAVVFWAWKTLNLLPGHATFLEKAQAFFYKKGDLTLLGQMLAFGAVVWGAFLLSRFVRFVLEEDLYPRIRMERGLSYAVSTMLHYAVLLFGFYTAAALAGIDMTKFNILVGAFGVGMGFGLQNIINNFVSGVILLFERPVKVGDVVQMSDASGTVDRIGIRASIIRTGSGSEIIVPNGKLISDQVTNWTLSNRLRGIDLPVSVAEGADPCRVIELLKGIAAAHPLVCTQPAPNALLTELGTDSMQFKLTAWTESYDQWGQIRSDLAVAVHAAFAREGIRRPATAPAIPPA
ncbi:MAG: mechanosensitive ion channel, partial [Chthoniobacteraceae bacterium]|nr:mechanosensitive ion channel [Chthoniobacteraceae bacterium]